MGQDPGPRRGGRRDTGGRDSLLRRHPDRYRGHVRADPHQPAGMLWGGGVVFSKGWEEFTREMEV